MKTKYQLINVVLFLLIHNAATAQEITLYTLLPSKAEYLSAIKQDLQKEWHHNRTINIVVHGHSVPAGYFKTPKVDTFNAYPHLLHQAVKEKYPYAVINVIVTAIGGENSQSGEKRFAEDVLQKKPDVILIDYGLNDRRLGLETAYQAWSSMILQAKTNNIKVILLTPTGDTSSNLDDKNDPLNQHAEQIQKLAVEHQVGLVDSLNQFKHYIHNGGKLEDLMSQVNHPNRKGHELVANELATWFID
jgi:lysophospholipase L1-like esterase